VIVYSRIYTWATGNWATAGLVGFSAFAIITLRRTAVESMSGLKTLVSYVAVRKYRNAFIVLLALLVSILGHWELKVTAKFRTLARNEFTVYAGTTGVLTEVLVRENTHVKKGELLARMADFDKQSDAERISGDLAQKKTSLERLRAGATTLELRQLETRIEAKKTELDGTRRNQQERSRLEEILAQRKKEREFLVEDAKTQKESLDEGLIARIKWLEAQNAVDVKEREIAQSEAAIKALNEKADRDADLLAKELLALESDLTALRAGNRPELIREAEADVTKLESLLKSLQQEIAKSEILAPIDGTVATPFPERMRGQKLATGSEFIRLVDTAGVTVEIHVPEKELEDVKPGNIVKLTFNSFPNADFQGRVDSIAPVAATVENQQMVRVLTQLGNEDGKLKPDMTGYARIYCGQRRIIDLLTYRLRRWVSTEFAYLLP
jgi:putative peptide zinc metalloprotease protein